MRTSLTASAGVALLLALTSGLTTPSALAQESVPSPATGSLHLSWARSAEAASCPDARHVMAEVTARLGSSPFATGSAAQGTIEVQVSRDRRAWYANISMRDAQDAPLGSRRVQSTAETCDSLGSAAVLAIALMIQPSLEPREPEPAPAAQPAAKPRAVPTAEARPPAPPALVPFAAVGVSAIAGALPEVSAGPTLQAGLHFNPLFVLQAGAHFFPQQWTSAAATRTGFGLTLGSLSGCLRFPIARAFAISSCGVMLAGAVHVAVDAPEPVKPGDGLWLAAGCGLALGLRAGPLELGLGAAALGHFQRRDYQVERDGLANASVFVEPGLAALTTLTLGTRL